MDATAAMSRTWLEVDESALVHNYRLAHSLCGEGVTPVCVLKANAYGLGLGRIGKTLWEAGARSYSVATADEALALRKALPEADILVMGVSGEAQLQDLIKNRIMLTAGTRADALAISDAACALGTQARIQIKIDTGLHRLGFEDVDEIARVYQLPGLKLEGLYSHLALRDEAQSNEQYQVFMHMEQALKEKGIVFEKRHLLDSIGLTRYPDWQMTAVRIGAFLYGNVPPSWKRFNESRETACLKTRVTRIAWVKKGEGIGYDEEPIERDTCVATLAAGYVDGYSRLLSGRGEVLIRGKRAKVLGLVCMDQMMVDVTEIPEVETGDVATLLGGGITLREYAAWGGLNRNECTAVIGTRVPRVYLRDGKIVAVSYEFQG